jgi:EAL domain-containing protein (putative c-di-GMP-specific phosphodiesterase class I)
LGPADFLAVAEKSGLLQAVDAWVLQQAMQTLGRWRAQGWWADRWRLSVNLTAIDLQQENFLPQLRGQLQSLSVPAELLEFELNEGALIRPTSAMLELLRDLRQLGLALSIDDFGTGYSSLAYLKQLPVSEIKIDRSFVADMLDNESNQAVVEAIISVAHKLGLAVVAEGVETPNQSAALQRLGCASGQGFLLSPAMSMEQFERDFLRHGAAA